MHMPSLSPPLSLFLSLIYEIKHHFQADLTAPRRFTEAEIRADISKYERKKITLKQTKWKWKGPFTQFFRDERKEEFNVREQAWHDTHHCYSVVIGDFLGLATNSGQMAFGPKRKAAERNILGRFKNVAKKRGEQPPWSNSKKGTADVNRVISETRTVIGEPELKPIDEWMKMAEKIKLAGPRGRWLFSIMDMNSEYKIKYIAALDVLYRMKQRPSLIPAARKAVLEDLVETFAWFELKLPLFWCTITKHNLWTNSSEQLSKLGSLYISYLYILYI